jgi:hypothetical protein
MHKEEDMMKKAIGLVLVLMLMMVTTTVAAGFEKTFNDWNINSIVNGEKTAYPLENENWKKTYGGWRYDVGISAQQTTDGGYVIVGVTASQGAGKDDVWLIKTDSTGTILWDHTFGGSKNDIGNSVQQTSDGGYIITGRTQSYGNGLDDVWLIKTDLNGTKVWDKTFGGTEFDGGSQVRQTTDGGYIIVGNANNNGGGDGDLWVIKTDANGDMQWDKKFDGEGTPLSHDSGSSVALSSDGGYIIAGGTFTRQDTFGYNVWLIKIDAEGNTLWNETFGGTDTEGVSSVIQTSDSGYLLVGVDSYSNADEKIWLIKTDKNGEFLWEQKYGGMGTARGESVQQTSDGGYVIAGFTYTKISRYKALLIKTDINGVKEWSKIFYGGIGNSIAFCAQQTADGGYIVCGERAVILNSNVWLIKYYRG